MNNLKRVWSAEEILGELPGWKDDPEHRAFWEELARYLAECTRLRVALEIFEREYENTKLEPFAPHCAIRRRVSSDALELAARLRDAMSK